MKEVLLIVHYESGDEIHLQVLDLSHLATIQAFVNSDVRKKPMNEVNDFLEFVQNNTLESIMCQTYVEMNSFENPYNIRKIIHIPELGM